MSARGSYLSVILIITPEDNREDIGGNSESPLVRERHQADPVVSEVFTCPLNRLCLPCAGHVPGHVPGPVRFAHQSVIPSARRYSATTVGTAYDLGPTFTIVTGSSRSAFLVALVADSRSA